MFKQNELGIQPLEAEDGVGNLAASGLKAKILVSCVLHLPNTMCYLRNSLLQTLCFERQPIEE